MGVGGTNGKVFLCGKNVDAGMMAQNVKSNKKAIPGNRFGTGYRILFCEMFFYVLGSRLVMLCMVTPKVEVLCSSAEVAGGRIPMAPSAISAPLKPSTNR